MRRDSVKMVQLLSHDEERSLNCIFDIDHDKQFGKQLTAVGGARREVGL